MRRHQSNKGTTPGPEPLNLNDVVAYNLRAARRLRGWTQAELASHLEETTGRRVTTSTVSSLERSWHGARRREFDVHEVALYAEVLDVPFFWFLMPPPETFRQLEFLKYSPLDLHILLFGRDDQVESIIDRLHSVTERAPRSAADLHEKLREGRTLERERSYLERRMQMLLAGLEARAEALETSTRELRSFLDYLRQVGVHDFIKEQTTADILAALPFSWGRLDAPGSEQEDDRRDESS